MKINCLHYIPNLLSSISIRHFSCLPHRYVDGTFEHYISIDVCWFHRNINKTLIYIYLRSEVLTAIYIKIMVLCDEMVCSCHTGTNFLIPGRRENFCLKHWRLHSRLCSITSQKTYHLNMLSLENYNSGFATSHVTFQLWDEIINDMRNQKIFSFCNSWDCSTHNFWALHTRMGTRYCWVASTSILKEEMRLTRTSSMYYICM